MLPSLPPIPEKEFILAFVATFVTVALSVTGYLDWRWSVLLICFCFTFAYLIRRANKIHWWTAKRAINMFLLVLWFIWLVTTGFAPTMNYGHFVFNNATPVTREYSEHLEGYSAVSYRIDITIVTDGVPSAYNPIHVYAILSNFNVSDPMNVCCLSLMLTGASYPLGPYMLLKPESGGVYSTEGYVTFFNQTETWPALIPPQPTEGGLYDPRTVLSPNELNQIKSQPALFSVGPQSDTLTLQFNAFAVKLAVVLGSFSILLLQPLVEGIFLREKD